jgi:dihydrofolate synthase / folylpolyglutamate synthase
MDRPHSPDPILARLKALHPRLIDLSLGRVERLLAALGNPERKLPPVVHVAGTNGKGSVVAYLAAMAQAAGLRAHVYTSPHLVRFNERIVVAGAEIDDATLSAYLERCELANAGAPITFFEITTAAAFLAFAERPADIALLEVGLGGRLDATNVIARPAVTAITPVSIDHTQYLGDTLAQIAFEKAGILKSGVPAVIGPQPAEAMTAIESRAHAIGAPLIHAAAADVATSLPGAHQRVNAGIALACARALKMPQLDERGIAQARWPGRLQRLKHGPLVAALAAGTELWLDGGHNPAAGAVLADWIAAQPGVTDIVVGMLNTKDAGKFLAALKPRVRFIRTVAVPDEENSLTADQLAALGEHAKPCANVAAAIADLAPHRSARVLICGSLYLAGHVLGDNS